MKCRTGQIEYKGVCISKEKFGKMTPVERDAFATKQISEGIRKESHLFYLTVAMLFIILLILIWLFI